MYLPAANRIDDLERACSFIDSHGFATVVTQRDGVPWASHLPVLLDRGVGERGRLRSHLARANEQWRHFDSKQEVLCIFFGPHAYISPSWYVSPVAVPTWNYATVHVYGYPRLEEDPAALRRIVEDTTRKYEAGLPQPWELRLPEATVDGLLRAIVGFEIAITRIEAKFKLGQNRPREDQEKMLRTLEASAHPDATALARFIRAQP